MFFLLLTGLVNKMRNQIQDVIKNLQPKFSMQTKTYNRILGMQGINTATKCCMEAISDQSMGNDTWKGLFRTCQQIEIYIRDADIE